MNISWAIAEHSICHPGLPRPHFDSQKGSFSFDFFHNAKSYLFLFSDVSLDNTPSPSFNFSSLPNDVGSSLA